MGVRNYLIEGVSGAGKTTLATELERRGYDVVHGDRVLAYYGDPGTGARLDRTADEPLEAAHQRWIWPVDKVRARAADRSHPVSFFCGGSRNLAQFVDVFDGIFVLALDAATLAERLSRRPADEFGGMPAERAFVLARHASGADLPAGAVRVSADRPVEQIADDIIALCGT